MPRVAAPDFRSFSDVAHQLAQEQLAARQLAQRAGAQQADVRLRQQQMQQQAQIEAARMAQRQGEFQTDVALRERAAGLSEIQEARRQFESVQAGEFARQQAAQRARMDEIRLRANDTQRSIATGTVFDFALGQRRAMTEDDPLWSARQQFQQQQHEEQFRAEAEEQRAERALQVREAGEARQLAGFLREPSPEQEAEQRLQATLAEQEALRGAGLGR